MKENEATLKREIEQLQEQVYSITMYLGQQKQMLDNHFQQADMGAYCHTFWNEQQVNLGYISQEQSVTVYVETGTMGKYKQVQPIISEYGGSKQLDFDMPYTGYAVIGPAFTSNTLTLPQAPMVIPTNDIMLLIEPEPEEPIIRTGIHDTWQR